MSLIFQYSYKNFTRGINVLFATFIIIGIQLTILSFPDNISNVQSEERCHVDLRIDSPVEYQFYQRSRANSANIIIEGTIEGDVEPLQASFAGRDFVDLYTEIKGNHFRSLMLNVETGQGDLIIRTKETFCAYKKIRNISIGDAFLMMGQSNQTGYGDNYQEYEHDYLKAILFGNDYNWKELEDPYDSKEGQIDKVSDDDYIFRRKPESSLIGGSYIPLLATHIMKNTNVPVMFIPAALSATNIEQWQPGDFLFDRKTLFGSAMYRAKVGSNGVKAVIWFQGEADSMDARSAEYYLSKLNNIIDESYHALGEDTLFLPIQVGNISEKNIKDGDVEPIRKALRISSIKDNVLTAPDLSDIDLEDEGGDGLHFKSDSDLQSIADRVWEVLEKEVY